MDKVFQLYNVLKSFFGFGSELPGYSGGVFPVFILAAITLFFVTIGILLLYKAIKAVVGLVAGFIGGFFV